MRARVFMRKLLGLVLLSLVVCHASSAECAIQPLPFSAVKVRDAFWSPRLETNRTVTIWSNFKKCEDTGRFENFDKAAGHGLDGELRGRSVANDQRKKDGTQQPSHQDSGSHGTWSRRRGEEFMVFAPFLNLDDWRILAP